MALLARAGVVGWQVFARYRRHAILASLILSAIVTPDATMFTMLLMAVPLMVLYEIGIWGAWWFRRYAPAASANQSFAIEGELPIETAGHRMR
jgi:sec-independent protein translocase protein TatC